MTVEAHWARATRAADASQAAYFRGLLADERNQIADDLVESGARLRDCLKGEQVVGPRAMTRGQFQVRRLESKQREVDRLIAALDRRYSALWSLDG